MDTNNVLFEKMTGAEHPYYCSSNEMEVVDGIEAYIKMMSGYDIDMNLVLRWDFYKADDLYSGDPEDEKHYGRPGTHLCKVTYVMQRKGYLRADHVINLTKEQMPALINWLRPRYERLLELWNPLPEVLALVKDPKHEFISRIRDRMNYYTENLPKTMSGPEVVMRFRQLTMDILGVLDGSDVHPGYVVKERAQFGDREEDDLAGGLMKYFQEINT